jgi:hypothetical protein
MCWGYDNDNNLKPNPMDDAIKESLQRHLKIDVSKEREYGSSDARIVVTVKWGDEDICSDSFYIGLS